MKTAILYFSTHEAAEKWAEKHDLFIIPKWITTGHGEEPGYWANDPETYLTKYFLVIRDAEGDINTEFEDLSRIR